MSSMAESHSEYVPADVHPAPSMTEDHTGRPIKHLDPALLSCCDATAVWDTLFFFASIVFWRVRIP
jgi:hypothetical protein